MWTTRIWDSVRIWTNSNNCLLYIINVFFANTRDEYEYDSEEMVSCQPSVYLHQSRGRWSHIFTNNTTDDANSRWGDLMWLRLTEECTFPVPVWWLRLSLLVKMFPTELCVFVPALWGDIHTEFKKQYCTYSWLERAKLGFRDKWNQLKSCALVLCVPLAAGVNWCYWSVETVRQIVLL